jgi:hypothetical protein
LGADPKSIASAATKDGLRYPCAIVVWNGLRLCAFDVDVDPLAVAGTFGKLVYSELTDNPIRCSKALANEGSTLSIVMSLMIGDILLTDDRLAPAQFRESSLPR